jgi:hypothetical protein
MGRGLPAPDFSRGVLLALTGTLSSPLAIRARRWGAAVLLCAAIGWVYRPGLNHNFVTDQLWYFAELGGSTSLVDGLRHYDYAATRRYWKGDDILFRPLLFTVLAVENTLLTYHHVWWNLVTVGLHALVAIALYRLLLSIQPSALAWLFALLFAVMTPPVELALWNHLSGYLLAWLCLTIGLRAFIQLSRGDAAGPRRGRTVVFVLAFGAACFLHESMVPISLLAAGLLLWSEWRGGVPVTVRRTLSLISPAIAFALIYVGVHVPRVQRLTYVDRSDHQSVLALGTLLELPQHVVTILTRWIGEALLPSAVTYKAHMIVRPTKEFAFAWTDPVHALNAGLAIALGGVLLTAVSARTLRARWPIIALTAAAAMAYVAVISLGRPSWEIANTSYYMYPVCVLFLTLLYTTLDAARLSGWRVRAAALLLIAGVALHATTSRTLTREIGNVHSTVSTYITAVARFVDEHRHEPGFTFALRPHPDIFDREIGLREGYPDDPAARIVVRRMTEILFARYYEFRDPRYVPF